MTEHNLNESSDPYTTFSCVECRRPNSVDNLVACDRCHSWWHYSCARVDDSIADRDWICPRCVPPVSKSLSVTSSSTRSSTRRARAELNLQRLADKKELEKKQLELEIERKYMEEKYRLIEQSLADDEEEYQSIRSHRSTISRLERQRQMNDWVENSIDVRGAETKRIKAPAVKDPNVDSHMSCHDGGVEQEGAVGGDYSSVPKTQQDASSTQPKQIERMWQFPLQGPQAQPLSLRELQTQLSEVQFPPKHEKQPVVSTTLQVPKGAIPKQRSNYAFDPSRPLTDFKQSRFSAPLGNEMLEEQELWPPAPRRTLPKQQPAFRFGITQTFTAPPPRCEATSAEQQRNTDQRSNYVFDPSRPLTDFKQSRVSAPLENEMLEEQKLWPPASRRTLPKQQPAFRFGVTQTYTAPPPRWEATSTEQQQNTAHSHQQQGGKPRVERPGHQEFTPQLFHPSLTPEHLAARQILPRDLPTFTGNPADWPVFISNYNYTSEACGYSDGENMIRLQRCLKGAAWESVRSRLILPASVPHVIEALRMRYGRPEILIESLTARVKSSPSPKADRLETIIEFGTMVQALCDHVIAADSLDHLANPSLLKDLVTKLPAEYRMKWARFRRNQATVDLKTFATFMEEIVTDAYSILSYAGPGTLDQHGKAKQDRSLVHTIDSYEDEENEKVDASESCKEERPTKLECSVCGKEGHKARECWTLKSLSVDDRWRKIQSLNLCRTCLFGHGRRACRSTMRCGIDGCQLQHHPLLHTTPKSPASVNQEQSVNHHIHQTLSSLLFRIIPVTLYNGTTSINAFALLDEGSSLTMIEDGLAAKLGVDGHNQPISLKWTASMTRRETNSRRVAFEISGLGDKKRFQLKNVGTIESLDLPTQSLPFEQLTKRYHHLRGLPVESYSEATPQLLIGLDNLRLAVPLKAREGGEAEPIAVKTRLGWCLYGGEHTSDTQCLFHLCENNDQPINETLMPAFNSEEVVQSAATSKAEKRASGLSWKSDNDAFPVRFSTVIRRCLTQDKIATSMQKNEEKPDQLDSLPLVGVGNHGRQGQRFVRRMNPAQVSDVLMEVKSFSSPATTQHVRERNVLLFSDQFPKAVKAIVHNHCTTVEVGYNDFKERNESLRPVDGVEGIQKYGGFDVENDEKVILKDLWEAIQAQLDRFWRRENIETGDMIPIIDDAKRNGWIRGSVRGKNVCCADCKRGLPSICSDFTGLESEVTNSGETLASGRFHGGENVAARTGGLAALPE